MRKFTNLKTIGDDDHMITEEVKAENLFGDLALLLFTVHDKAKIYHLSTTSFSQHMALGSLYEDILDVTDETIEVIQGKYGIIDIEGTIKLDRKEDPIKYLKGTVSDIADIYGKIDKKDTNILNLLDEITSLIERTLYKLENLK